MSASADQARLSAFAPCPKEAPCSDQRGPAGAAPAAGAGEHDANFLSSARVEVGIVGAGVDGVDENLAICVDRW